VAPESVRLEEPTGLTEAGYRGGIPAMDFLSVPSTAPVNSSAVLNL
jgi:hypothetical protein